MARRSVGSQHVHDEHEGVGALDHVALALLAVAELGRDHQQYAAADRDADQALVPALDDLANANCNTTEYMQRYS